MNEQKVNEELEKLKTDIDFRKIDKISRTSRNVSLFIVPVLFLLFAYGSIKLRTLYTEVKQMEERRQSVQLEYKALDIEKKALENKKNMLEKELMTTYGLPIDSILKLSTTEVLEKSLHANEAIKNIIHQHTADRTVTIRYYNKTIDEKRTAVELQALGYAFEAKAPTGQMKDKKTNAVWFGAGVSLNDVKLISLALLRAGVPIRGIRPYDDSAHDPNYKRKIVEVGASVDLEDRPLVTVDEVTHATEFKRHP